MSINNPYRYSLSTTITTRLQNAMANAFDEGAAAQLAKADKEWAEWWERTISECRACTCKYMTPDCEIIQKSCKAWQERRKEIGL